MQRALSFAAAMSSAWSKHRALLAIVAAGVLTIGIASGVVASKLAAPRPGTHRLTATASAAPEPSAAPTPEQWWKPLPTATAAFQPALLVIEKLKVQAPVEVKGLDAHNVMEVPDNPTDAAWYRFTAKPGSGGNAVFSGHRDFGQVGNPAIFWHLDQLVAGDQIDVVSDKRTQISYRVSQTWEYRVSDMPMQQVLATDRSDEVTLITGSGTYLRGGYDHRLVVRAVRAS